MTGAGSAGDSRGRRPSHRNEGARSAGERDVRNATEPDRGSRSDARAVIDYLRSNPQVLVLLVICLVLGLGTFFAVVFGLLTAGSGQTTGEPSGAIMPAHALIATVHTLIP